MVGICWAVSFEVITGTSGSDLGLCSLYLFISCGIDCLGDKNPSVVTRWNRSHWPRVVCGRRVLFPVVTCQLLSTVI
jgi:hypothetical protein